MLEEPDRMVSSFVEVTGIVDEVKRKHPNYSPDQIIEIVKLVVYNHISIDWIEIIETVH